MHPPQAEAPHKRAGIFHNGLCYHTAALIQRLRSQPSLPGTGSSFHDQTQVSFFYHNPSGHPQISKNLPSAGGDPNGKSIRFEAPSFLIPPACRFSFKAFSFSPQVLVEKSLKGAALWDEVKDRLHDSALGLSGGQQQRLCIARTLAVSPEIILMDEPCSALDPIATSKIETLITELKKNYTVIIVTHNMQQAARVSDTTGFMYLGKLVEVDDTKKIFSNPSEELTERYVTGRFG